jgi:hypothetical protein
MKAGSSMKHESPSDASERGIDALVAANPIRGRMDPLHVRFIAGVLLQQDDGVMLMEYGLKIIACQIVLVVQEHLVRSQPTILGVPAHMLFHSTVLLLQTFQDITYEDLAPAVAAVDGEGAASALLMHPEVIDVLWERAYLDAQHAMWALHAMWAKRFETDDAGAFGAVGAAACGATASRAALSTTDEAACDAGDSLAATSSGRSFPSSSSLNRRFRPHSRDRVLACSARALPSRGLCAAVEGPGSGDPFAEHTPVVGALEQPRGAQGALQPLERIARQRLAKRDHRARLLLILPPSLWFASWCVCRLPMMGERDGFSAFLSTVCISGGLLIVCAVLASSFPSELHSPAGRQLLLPAAIATSVYLVVASVLSVFYTGAHV